MGSNGPIYSGPTLPQGSNAVPDFIPVASSATRTVLSWIFTDLADTTVDPGATASAVTMAMIVADNLRVIDFIKAPFS